MKNILGFFMNFLLCFIALFFFSSIYAEASIPIDKIDIETEINKNPSSFNKAIKSGAEITKKKTSKIGGKIVISCLMSKKLCAGIALTGVTLNYLYEHPELVSEYLEKHPEHYDEVQKYLLYRKVTAKSEDEILKYEQAEVEVGLTERTYEEQIELEKTPEFLLELSKISEIINTMNETPEMEEHSKKCNILVPQKLLTSNVEFNTNVNPFLPKINNGYPTIFNVDKYKNLYGKRKEIERDHIPSYKAMEVFFKNKNINMSKFIVFNKRIENLNSNLTAINLSYDSHRMGRTYGSKNILLSKIDGVSSKSLETATKKDLASILLFEIKNPSNYNEVLKASISLYIRNKILCLYDIE